MSSKYLMTHSSSLQAAGFAPSFAFDSSLVALARLGCMYLTRYNNIPMPNQYSHWSSTEIFLLLTIGLTIRNLWLPGVLWLQTSCTSLQNFYPYFWLDRAVLTSLSLSSEIFILQDKWSCSPYTIFSISPLLFNTSIASLIASISPIIKIIYVKCYVYYTLCTFLYIEAWIDIGSNKTWIFQNLNGLFLVLLCCLNKALDVLV